MVSCVEEMITKKLVKNTNSCTFSICYSCSYIYSCSQTLAVKMSLMARTPRPGRKLHVECFRETLQVALRAANYAVGILFGCR